MGRLTADPVYGTSLNGHPVMWPLGYSARHAGFAVTVANAAGKVVATTGRDYVFSQARVGGSGNASTMERLGAVPASADCGYSWSFIDCTAATASTSDAGPATRTFCVKPVP